MATIIEQELANAGYKMLGLEDKWKTLILSILDSENIRYLKAIPFLIYNHPINLERIYRETNKKKLFAQMIGLTRRIFAEEGINKQLPELNEPSKFNFEEFKQEFELQKSHLEKPESLIERQKIYAERDFQMWLSQIFTKKEKQIIRRILENNPVSKSDYEYYSRKTKKKLNSIINLQDIARTLYHQSPKLDEDLFKLKKLLEEKYGQIKSFSLQNNYLLLTPINNKDASSSSIKTIDIKLIRNEEITLLLQSYKEKYKEKKQDFT